MTRDEFIAEIRLSIGRENTTQGVQRPSDTDIQRWINRTMIEIQRKLPPIHMDRMCEAFLTPGDTRFGLPGRTRAIMSAVLIDEPTNFLKPLKAAPSPPHGPNRGSAWDSVHNWRGS